jgi:hypothetical protein
MHRAVAFVRGMDNLHINYDSFLVGINSLYFRHFAYTKRYQSVFNIALLEIRIKVAGLFLAVANSITVVPDALLEMKNSDHSSVHILKDTWD